MFSALEGNGMTGVACEELVRAEAGEKHSCRGSIRRGLSSDIVMGVAASTSSEVKCTGYREIHLRIMRVD